MQGLGHLTLGRDDLAIPHLAGRDLSTQVPGDLFEDRLTGLAADMEVRHVA